MENREHNLIDSITMCIILISSIFSISFVLSQSPLALNYPIHAQMYKTQSQACIESNVYKDVKIFSTIYKNWNFDPNNLLNNPLLNPELKDNLLKALKSAYDKGLKVQ